MEKHFYKTSVILLAIFYELTYACSTCYGDPNSNAGKGMDMAIITLCIYLVNQKIHKNHNYIHIL